MDDLPAFFGMLSDPETMRYWSSAPHASIEVTRPWVTSMVSGSAETSDEWVLEHEGSAVGKFGCYRLPEVGYLLRRDQWGRGLMHEAGLAVIAYLWRTRDVSALQADVDPRNQASLRVLGKLGFVETHRATRTFCIEGTWTDSVYLTLPRPVGARESA